MVILDYDVRTERVCLLRPPSDGEQRCADTNYEHKKVYMCFCRGDLCNASVRTAGSIFTLLVTLTLFLLS